MADPQKMQIAAATVEVLRGISIGAGSYTNLGRSVARGYRALADMNSTEFPRLAVYFAEGVDDGGAMGGQYWDEDVLVVEASLRTIRPDDLEDEMLRAEDDIFREMLADPGLANTALELRRVKWETERNNRTDESRGRVYARFSVRSTRSL